MKQKRGMDIISALDCDAIEVCNAKVDGSISPAWSLITLFKKCRMSGRSISAIFGLDLHNIHTPRDVWIECKVKTLTQLDILDSLRAGHFKNRTKYVEYPSNGNITLLALARLLVFRVLYVLWDTFLASLPVPLRNSFIHLTSPLIALIK